MNAATPMQEPLGHVLSCLKGVRRIASGWEALCPAHEDANPSLTVSWSAKAGDAGGVVLRCHRGCETADVIAAAGLEWKDLFPPKPETNAPPAPAPAKKKREKGKIVATYDYEDEQGELLYQVVRFDPKDFRQRRPNGKGKWTWSLGDVRRVPFRLPQLLQAIRDRRIVFVVEGEKDALLLEQEGFVATCNAGGADKGSNTKWRPELNDHFAGARVVILPDNDEPGWAHAQHVAQQLQGVAAEVQIVELPLGPRLPKHGKDVADWFSGGNTAADLKRLVRTSGSPPEPPEYVTGELLNDYGNARRLVRIHGRDLRYVAVWGSWLVWDGTRWKKDGDGAAMRYAKRTSLSVFDEAKEAASKGKDAQALSKWANRSLSGKALREMLAIAESEEEVIATTEDLDTDPWLFNVSNGTVDLRTGELLPHSRDDLITHVGGVEYQPDAQAPRWEAFLERIMDGDRELIGFLQRAAGYSLTGVTREQCLFMPYGTGANGKSIFLGRLSTLMGDYAETAESTSFLNKGQDTVRNDLAKLAGARYVTAIEVDQGRRMAEALVKQVTGEDPITARFLRQEYFSFLPQFKLWMAANHKPSIRGGDHGIWRRIHLIPFTVTIPPEERDADLAAKLEEELPGILNWAIRGCLDWQRGGLRVPDSVRAATAQYESEMDPIGAFFDDCVELMQDDPTSGAALWAPGEGFDPVPAISFYQAYTEWCEANGERPLTNRTFGDRVKQRGVQWKRVKTGNVYLGIRLVKGGAHHFGENAIANPHVENNRKHPTPSYTTLHQQEEKSDLHDIFDDD